MAPPPLFSLQKKKKKNLGLTREFHGDFENPNIFYARIFPMTLWNVEVLQFFQTMS